MNRKEFIRSCALSCAALTGLPLLTESCAGNRYVQSSIEGRAMRVAKTEFEEQKKEKTAFRKYVIVRAANFPFPIIVYRNSDTDFYALMLQCTHQGNELNVNGDVLTCAAHGSEFGKKGEVIQGPAEQPLKSFKVVTEPDAVYIQMT